ncbi:hypothetical protein JR316_0009484 [Psilocybe cubensis]|uniref:Uncharacterized protein n=3 Tax=Psilocybe cubensis TaxID=181762 RepID=A0ACB8GNF7_PSICU|nr:hypothetical protein JR316_0009484 [Psilocybe cubensis]KAH9477280.1 hypothetical protein JR316_0009484 [Psilocybe cubensis]
MPSSALPPSNALFPALYLYPLNDTWAPKRVALTNMHTKIGWQPSSKTTPGERNGFFDSKVLSRQHAEVWEEGGKIYIKDVKSSNGTFINGERLSSEGHESEPFELKSNDIVELGIDVVGEDNKTIIHHKVAARRRAALLPTTTAYTSSRALLRHRKVYGGVARACDVWHEFIGDVRRGFRVEEGSHEEAMGERHHTCDDEDEGGEGHEDDDEEEEDDDDDARSVSTIIPHKLESVEEEDEEAVARAERGEDGDGDLDHEARDAQHGVEDKDHSVSEIVDSSSLDQEHEHEQSHEHGSEDEAEAEKWKQEDLKVGKPRSSGASGSEDKEDRESGDKKAMPAQKLKGRKGVGLVDDPMRMLATPEPYVVFKLSESTVSSLDGDRDQDKSLLSGKTRTHPLADSSDVDADVLSRSFDEDSIAGKYKQSSGDGLEGGGIECARASPFSSSSTYARGAFLIVFWVFVSCVLGVLGVFVGLAISVYSWLVSGVVWISSSSVARWLSTVDLDSLAAALPDARVHAWATQALQHLNKGKGKDGAGNSNINVQTAVDVVLLSVAAAAVFWKIKPE